MNIRCIELWSEREERQYFLRRQEPMVDGDVTMITLSTATRQLKSWKWIDLKHSGTGLTNAIVCVNDLLREGMGADDLLLTAQAFALLLR